MINVIMLFVGGALGLLLDAMGYPPMTWQFWAVLGFALAFMAAGLRIGSSP